MSGNSDRAHLNRLTNFNEAEKRFGFAPCMAHFATHDVRQDYLGLIINKNSWLREQVNRRIQWLRSYGIVNYLYKQYNPPGCRVTKLKDRRKVTKSLSFTQMQGVLWVWLVGMFLATLVFMLEKLIKILEKATRNDHIETYPDMMLK
ncbi:hypothetical protein SK128_001139 [Halocaridina rubra]|uniref:Uncharacterized protein n=1 Tax=Halocaridina rubra TaxID=373956 RepID=A0AAN8WFM5_HALRR